MKISTVVISVINGGIMLIQKTFTLTLLLCFHLVFAQNSSGEGNINQKDANNLKQGHWIINNEGGKFPGYAEGQKVEEGQYLNNKKVGVWTKYYPNGKKNHEITFANNVPNGYAKFYYKDGTIQEEGMWQNNKWIGEYKYYHENGQIFYKWNYNTSGKRQGRQEYYHETGNLMYEGEWSNGNEAGVIKEYYEDGSLKTERTFNDGKLEATAIKTYPVGKVYHPNAKKIVPTGRALIKDEQITEVIKLDKEGKIESVSKPEPQPETASKETAAKPVVKESGSKDVGVISDGFHTTYDSKGNKIKEGEFKGGRLVEGKEYQYGSNGKVVKSFTVKGGVKVEDMGDN